MSTLRLVTAVVDSGIETTVERAPRSEAQPTSKPTEAGAA